MAIRLDELHRQLGRRVRQFSDIIATEGAVGLAVRARRSLATKLMPPPILPVLQADVLAADLSRRMPRRWRERNGRRPFVINWVLVPPSPGSGGHATAFRIINQLAKLGYENRVYFYDVYRGDHAFYAGIARRYFDFSGFIGKVEEGLEDADAVMATCWASAYPVYNSPCAGERFYFVQDFEPLFYPAGSLSVLAENTYRMGFHAITAGRWLADKLSREYGMCADYFEFGCDTVRYRRLPGNRRTGIAFYARGETPRRGVEIGLLAIELFARRRPEIEIHFYGGSVGSLPFPVINHGRVDPERLNEIYNSSFAGLSLSLTNVSLVPHEMLAAGCIPVVNDSVPNRMVLNNDHVRYTPLNPHAIAAKLEAIVSAPDLELQSSAASASVVSRTWQDAGARVDASLRRVLAREVPKAGGSDTDRNQPCCTE